MDNRTIAEKLSAYAQYLEAREENLYRVQAYRRAAETVLRLDRPVADLVAEEGRDGLERLPGIGRHLSYTIEGLARTGELRTWGGEAGHIDSERLFGSLPGVGPQLARRIREGLGIETLEQLEQAAHDGRLGQLEVGPKRLRGIIDALAGRLQRRRLPERAPEEPTVAELLAVDEEYRTRAARGELPTLAPRRFNPNQEPWLPLLEVRRGRWRYRALFSNTATAHRLGQTHDWVVIYFYDGPAAGQRTVVTETRGDLRGRRVIRGRESECGEYYHPAGDGAVAAPRCPETPAGALAG
jgi:hypothetical protein